ncbi:MAG TPA: rhodanese-like domain-containing protein [Chloroflexota bacterium]|nr:rhodanese-like domain-containing protein [Chloroflexota bacterium]
MSDYVDPRTLREQQESGNAPTIVDVRGPEEYAAGHVPGAVNIPEDQLPSHLAEIPRDRSVVVY